MRLDDAAMGPVAEPSDRWPSGHGGPLALRRRGVHGRGETPARLAFASQRAAANGLTGHRWNQLLRGAICGPPCPVSRKGERALNLTIDLQLSPVRKPHPPDSQLG